MDIPLQESYLIHIYVIISSYFISHDLFYITTVLTPVILTLLPVSPILTQVGDTINLTCRGLGGPRLVLSWLKNSSEVASGQMGMTSLTFSLDLFDGCDFGNYTCTATIDDMQQSSTVLVAARGELKLQLLMVT